MFVTQITLFCLPSTLGTTESVRYSALSTPANVVPLLPPHTARLNFPRSRTTRMHLLARIIRFASFATTTMAALLSTMCTPTHSE